LIASAGQTDQFLKWKHSGEMINSLDHRMYFYADPSKSDLIDQVLLDITLKSNKLKNRPNNIGTFSFESLQQLGDDVAFLDITPTAWNGVLHCVRCYSSTMFPLLVSENMVTNDCKINLKSRLGLPHPFP
jgi:hypothetical protein